MFPKSILYLLALLLLGKPLSLFATDTVVVEDQECDLSDNIAYKTTITILVRDNPSCSSIERLMVGVELSNAFDEAMKSVSLENVPIILQDRSEEHVTVKVRDAVTQICTAGRAVEVPVTPSPVQVLPDESPVEPPAQSPVESPTAEDDVTGDDMEDIEEETHPVQPPVESSKRRNLEKQRSDDKTFAVSSMESIDGDHRRLSWGSYVYSGSGACRSCGWDNTDSRRTLMVTTSSGGDRFRETNQAKNRTRAKVVMPKKVIKKAIMKRRPRKNNSTKTSSNSTQTTSNPVKPTSNSTGTVGQEPAKTIERIRERRKSRRERRKRFRNFIWKPDANEKGLIAQLRKSVSNILAGHLMAFCEKNTRHCLHKRNIQVEVDIVRTASRANVKC